MSGRRSWTAHLMGTVFSVHLIGRVDRAAADAAVNAFIADLTELERLFSPFQDDSEISRMRRGTLELDGADPRVREVADECQASAVATAGRFDAAWRGGFDPTGYVKGWAVDRAGARYLAPLLHARGAIAVGVGAGGDVRVWTPPGASWTWRIGIADPHRSGATLATIELANGAVATSGTAERGAHIIDPRTGAAATTVRSATIVAADLATADVWATAAVVAGIDDLSWIGSTAIISGMVVGEDATGTVIRRWSHGIEIETVAAA